MDLSNIWLAIVALFAATINGAIGYGFSSIVTPIALLWFSNKVLNPALVSVELIVNITLLFRERAYISVTRARAWPVVSTLYPGVLLGTIGLTYLAVNDVKVVVYVFRGVRPDTGCSPRATLGPWSPRCTPVPGTGA